MEPVEQLRSSTELRKRAIVLYAVAAADKLAPVLFFFLAQDVHQAKYICDAEDYFGNSALNQILIRLTIQTRA